MKPGEDVAATTPFVETTPYGDMNTPGLDTGGDKRNTSSRCGVSKPGKAAGVQTKPSKAPLEMANAIRRRKQTSDLDYWHSLPPGPQAARPVYKAVIRGPLTGDNAVCTLSSIVDAATDRQYNMVVKRNAAGSGYHVNGIGIGAQNKNVSVIRAEDMGLTISGLSISEVKTKPQGNLNSPRGVVWKGCPPINARQSKALGQNQILNTTTTTNGPETNSTSCDSDANSKTATSNSKPTALSPKGAKQPPKSSPRLRMTTRNKSGDSTDGKRMPFSPRSAAGNSRREVNTSLDLPQTAASPRNALLRQTSLPIASSDSKLSSDFNGHQSYSSPMETGLAKRKFSQEVDNNKKRLSAPNNISSSSCLQFADSVLGAMTTDLSKIYSICQAKVRYAEFIEQSQPHRLGDKEHEGRSTADDRSNSIKVEPTTKDNTDKENNSFFTKIITKDLSPKSSFPSQSTSPVLSASTSLLFSSTQNPTSSTISSTTPTTKTGQPLRLAPLATRNNKPITFRDQDQNKHFNHYDKPHTTILIESPSVKTTRPILKSSKTDIDTSSVPPFRNYGDKTDPNNNSTNLNNRLVRFNVNHEVREFAPSEPVRIS